jgi:hypothetical protein
MARKNISTMIVYVYDGHIRRSYVRRRAKLGPVTVYVRQRSVASIVLPLFTC